jgi:hypothetical protein
VSFGVKKSHNRFNATSKTAAYRSRACLSVLKQTRKQKITLPYLAVKFRKYRFGAQFLAAAALRLLPRRSLSISSDALLAATQRHWHKRRRWPGSAPRKNESGTRRNGAALSHPALFLKRGADVISTSLAYEA